MILEAPDDSLYLTTDIHKGQLPEFLERAISVADITAQKDMLLISALTAASYAMPHIRILHGRPQHIYSPNLISLIVAPPASGKGVMNNAELLLEPINEFLAQGGRNAIYSGDFSSSSFVRTLAKNEGEIFMIQTEMDKMGKNWRQTGNDFSDMFRQAFEHETIRYSRSTGTYDTIDINIKHPQLSVLLSGTLDQLRPLVGDGQNGLASRFLPYIVDEKIPFDPNVLGHGDSYEENGVHHVYKQLSEDLFRRWQYLSGLEEDILWSLTPEQSQTLGALFADAYNLAFEPTLHMPEVFDATVKRLLVIILRLGAILTTLRLPLTSPNGSSVTSQQGICGMNSRETVPPTLRGEEATRFVASSLSAAGADSAQAQNYQGECSEGLEELHPANSVLYCSDQDFQTLATLSEKLLRHAALMILMLNEEKENPATQQRNTKATGLLDLLPNQFTTADAVTIGNELGVTERAVRLRLKVAVENKVIRRTTRGKYRKA